MSETLEELKAIIENAPSDATHACIENGTHYQFKVIGLDAEIYTADGWLCYSGCALPDLCGVRLISDIKRIIELMEINAETQKQRASSSEAYGKFIGNMGRDHKLDLMLSNSIVNQCINLGYVRGMSEVETLKSAIAAMIKLSDDDLKNKIDLAMRRVNQYSKGAL